MIFVASRAVRLLRNPITGIADCCARVASGNIALEPTKAMNALRFIRSPRQRVSRVLGIGDKDVAVPFSALKTEQLASGRRIVLDVTKDGLQLAPAFQR
jgi:hypothetical protein